MLTETATSALVFIIQIILILCVIFYLYFAFRNNIQTPTVAQLVEQLSPGLSDLTKTHDTIVFWFYSISADRYHKYTMDRSLVAKLVADARVHDRVADPTKGFYFNFGLQRWERTTYVDAQPTVTEDSIEQRTQVCYTTEVDGSGNLVCYDDVKKTLIRLQIKDTQYKWDKGRGVLVSSLASVSFFPARENMCKFTSNRYREYMGLEPTDEAYGNVEQKVNVYFVRDTTTKWQIRECANENMFFDGQVCKIDAEIAAIEPRTMKHGGASSGIFLVRQQSSDLEHRDAPKITSYYLHLNNTYSTYVNVSAAKKIYTFEYNFYGATRYSIFIIGERKDETADPDDGDNYNWRLEQLLNNDTRAMLEERQLQLIPILERPYQLFVSRSGEILTVGRRFVIYRNYIYYEQAYLMRLYNMIVGIRNYTVERDDRNESIANGNCVVANTKLLPQLRKYVIENSHGDLCKLFATFVGDCLLDVYGETRLLVDYIADIHKYEFYGRRNTYPIIEDDFQLETWSCAQIVENPDMYTYIALVDVYDRLATNATGQARFDR